MKWYEKQKKLYDQNQKEIVGSEGKTLTSQEKEAAVEQTVKKEQLMKKEIQVKAAQPKQHPQLPWQIADLSVRKQPLYNATQPYRGI